MDWGNGIGNFLVSGILSIVFGIAMWRQWPLSGIWAVGVLVGVDLLMTGISMITVAVTIDRLTEPLKDPAAT